MTSRLEAGLTATMEYVVGPGDTALALLSGDLEVLGTPRMIAWLESATCAAVRDGLGAGATTVGTRVAVEHLAASPVGATVVATATLTSVAGRVLTFDVEATDRATGAILGRGAITRAVVDAERFLARLG